MEKKKYIVGVGSTNLDVMGRSKKTLIQEDSNPGRIQVSVGGATHNACENAARLGTPVTLVTPTGDDHFGKTIKNACDDAGLDTSHFIIVPGHASSTYMSVHNPNGEMDIAISDMSIMEQFTIEKLKEKDQLLREASAITFDTGLPQEIINYLLATYGDVTPIFADAVSTTYAEKLVDNLQGVYTLKPNLLEAEILSGMEIKNFDDLEKAAKAIVGKGAKRVFISLGRHGVYYADAEGVTRWRRCKPMEQIANATGAGDSFLGAMLYAHVNAFDLEETLKCAMTVSMLTIQSDNTINPQMSEQFMKDNLDLATEDTSINSQDITF